MFSPRKLVVAFWCYSFLGSNVATYRESERKMVPIVIARKQHEESKWIQGIYELNYTLPIEVI